MSNQHQHHRPRDSHGRQSFAKLPPRPDHGPLPSRPNGTESPRHPPSASSNKPLVIDLTDPPIPQSFSSQTTAVGTPSIDGAGAADVPNGVAEAAKLYDGALCPKAATQNSRSAKRLRFAAQAPPQSPQFIQPSKVYSNNKHPATPPAMSRGGATARQKQIQPQPTRSDFAKPNSRRDNKPKPYVLESPPSAQLLPDTSTHPMAKIELYERKKRLTTSPTGCADFFPWRGNHPEDHVTDAQARNGQYDKLFVGKGNVPLTGLLTSQSELVLTALQNEQASARASLAPIFKQKAGLSTMSSLFLTVLDKRQKYGRFTTPSTFKPPPRVTLPDQRRETWLRDLASSLVPLRKLSRTIPHGLKGPVLLDQCTAKHIPTGRAVWFARCVGANELRGLKRKGVGSFAVGSETKWIKEWTTQVVRFLEGKISACGISPTGAWKAKMVYAYVLPPLSLPHPPPPFGLIALLQWLDMAS